ncbi:hypothetical protein DYQ05_01125 [Treponema pedis]|nr:hypothetical protein DYQ05_01125 [Treponema pedis]
MYGTYFGKPGFLGAEPLSGSRTGCPLEQSCASFLVRKLEAQKGTLRTFLGGVLRGREKTLLGTGFSLSPLKKPFFSLFSFVFSAKACYNVQ